MNMLNENEKKEKTTKQKIVLYSLIISVILLIIIIATIVLLLINKPEEKQVIKMNINNLEVKTSEEFIITAQNGENFIALKELAILLNYTYYNGAYLEFSEDKTKCYIDNKYEIIGFEVNSKKIYKIVPTENLGYQYYELNSEILSYNDKLYINLNDLPVALNLVLEEGTINTTEVTAETYKEKVKEKGFDSIDIEENNLKAIAYNLLVISKNNKKGIINKNLDEVIGTKYDTMEFNEIEKEFIVSSNKKYGIIKANGTIKTKLIYDEIKIVNYNPLIYAVKKDEKIGIINKDNLLIANTEYDKIGYNENKQENIEYTVIIPSINDNIGDTVVVSKEEKYGLIEIDTGEIIIECTTDGIYKKVDNEKEEYIVNLNGQTVDLEYYLQYIYIKQ